jgi:hypothetical protein
MVMRARQELKKTEDLRHTDLGTTEETSMVVARKSVSVVEKGGTVTIIFSETGGHGFRELFSRGCRPLRGSSIAPSCLEA